MKKIALIEDDLILSDTVVDILERFSYKISQAFTLDEARDMLYEERFDLIILDVTMPDGNGFEFAKYIRNEKITTPILFLTSLADPYSVSKGFSSGGDDYLKKPFDPLELTARVENLIKRSFFHTESNYINIDSNYIFDPIKEAVFTTQKQQIHLLTKELAILKSLLAKKGQVVTYDEIFEAAWNFDESPSLDSLRSHLKNIRAKMLLLEIETIRQVGYKIA